MKTKQQKPEVKVGPLGYLVAALACVYSTIALKYFGAPDWLVLLFVLAAAYYGTRYYSIVRWRD